MRPKSIPNVERMDYSPQAKHVEFPFTEVFVQIAETQNQYVVCVCGERKKKEYKNSSSW